MHVRNVFTVCALSGSLLAAGCGGGGGGHGGGGSGGPTLAITTPATNQVVRVGDVVSLQYADADDGVAMTVLFADRDGNPDTTEDSFDLTRSRPDQDGATQTVPWETAGLTPGLYHVFATTWDGSHAPLTVEAGGTVTVQANAWSGGGPGYDYTYDSAVFADGSSVVVGTFEGETVFGSSEANETTLQAAGAQDAFVARYGADGTLTWARRAGGTDYDLATGVSTFADGSCVVTGQFRVAATFGAGEPGQTTLSGANDQVFVARFAANGDLVWAKGAGGPNYEQASEVAALADGTCVVTGTFDSSAVFGSGEVGQTTLSGSGQEVFVARYASTGALLWAKSAGGGGYDQGGGIAAFADGTCVVTGTVTIPATFGAGEPNQTVLSGSGQEMFVARFASNGTLVWAKGSNGPDQAGGQSIATFADGSCVVSGQLVGSETFGSGEMNQTTLSGPTMFFMGYGMFVARYSPSGSLVWAKATGGNGGGVNGRGLATFGDGSCVVAGDVSGTTVFGVAEANETTLSGLGSSEAFLARYDAGGTLAWAVSFGGRDGQSAAAVDVLTDGSLLVSGWFQFLAAFGTGQPTETTLGSVVTYADVFVARFAADGSF